MVQSVELPQVKDNNFRIIQKDFFGELNMGSKSCSAVMEVDLESDPAHTSTPPGSPLSLQLNLSISVETKRRLRADL